MINPAQEQKYRKQFASVESSFRIEGMDPSDDPIYRRAKEAILAGTMTPDQALTYVVQETEMLHRAMAEAAQ